MLVGVGICLEQNAVVSTQLRPESARSHTLRGRCRYSPHRSMPSSPQQLLTHSLREFWCGNQSFSNCWDCSMTVVPTRPLAWISYTRKEVVIAPTFDASAKLFLVFTIVLSPKAFFWRLSPGLTFHLRFPVDGALGRNGNRTETMGGRETFLLFLFDFWSNAPPSNETNNKEREVFTDSLLATSRGSEHVRSWGSPPVIFLVWNYFFYCGGNVSRLA